MNIFIFFIDSQSKGDLLPPCDHNNELGKFSATHEGKWNAISIEFNDESFLNFRSSDLLWGEI